MVQLPNFTSIVDANRGAVVNITVTENQKTSTQSPFPDFGGNDPFSQFFRQFKIPQQQQPMHGLGSGFIVRSDGVIMTNAHVVDGASDVMVKLSDRREFKAKVIGVDKQTDIAVVKIDAKDLPTVKLGDSKAVQVGQWVLAIGSPYGFENTVTAGIVSATSRALPDGTYTPFIQTDAAVNPGNSGGPLFNMSGQVIGINSQIYSRTGGYQGLSFAIPINLASQIEQQLLAHGKVERGRIGVTIQDVSQGLAQSFGLDKPAGALVSSVEKGSPADKAGLESGDVILGMNGQKIERSNELPPMVAAVKPGNKATFDIWRKGSRKEITVTVGKFKGAKVASAAGSGDQQRSPWPRGAAAYQATKLKQAQTRRRPAGRERRRAGRGGRHSARRRDPRRQRQPGEERAAAARAGCQRRQARRAADPARRCEDLRSGGSRLSPHRRRAGGAGFPPNPLPAPPRFPFPSPRERRPP